MKKFWPLVALGIASYLAFALVTLPARVITSRLPESIVVAGVDGTAWNGRASLVQVEGFQLDSVSWKLHVLPLFTAQLKADIKATRGEGFLQGTVATRGGADMTLVDVAGSLPLAALPPAATSGGWTGTLNAKLARLELKNGWPMRADGTIEVMDLAGPARRPTKLGSYKVVFPPELTGNALVGALSDLGGPLEIAGNLRLNPDRSYVVEGSVVARQGADKSMTDALQFLGAPDAQGRRSFSFAGTM